MHNALHLAAELTDSFKWVAEKNGGEPRQRIDMAALLNAVVALRACDYRRPVARCELTSSMDC